MKVLIWIGCLLIYPITAAIFRIKGILLDAIPTCLLCVGSIALAKFLSGRVGQPSKKKEAEIKARVASGETHHLRAKDPADTPSQDQ